MKPVIKAIFRDSLPYTIWQEREHGSALLVASFADDEDAFHYGVQSLDREAGWYVRYFHGHKVFKSEDIDRFLAVADA